MEKPLHVRVAEALGLGPRKVRAAASDHFVEVWTDNHYWLSDGQHRETELRSIPIPHYDTDWSVTGPLIERLGITLLRDYSPGAPEGWRALYRAADDLQFGADFIDTAVPVMQWQTGDFVAATPLIAACNLILALAAAGKLAA